MTDIIVDSNYIDRDLLVSVNLDTFDVNKINECYHDLFKNKEQYIEKTISLLKDFIVKDDLDKSDYAIVNQYVIDVCSHIANINAYQNVNNHGFIGFRFSAFYKSLPKTVSKFIKECNLLKNEFTKMNQIFSDEELVFIIFDIYVDIIFSNHIRAIGFAKLYLQQLFHISIVNYTHNPHFDNLMERMIGYVITDIFANLKFVHYDENDKTVSNVIEFIISKQEHLEKVKENFNFEQLILQSSNNTLYEKVHSKLKTWSNDFYLYMMSHVPKMNLSRHESMNLLMNEFCFFLPVLENLEELTVEIKEKIFDHLLNNSYNINYLPVYKMFFEDLKDYLLKDISKYSSNMDFIKDLYIGAGKLEEFNDIIISFEIADALKEYENLSIKYETKEQPTLEQYDKTKSEIHFEKIGYIKKMGFIDIPFSEILKPYLEVVKTYCDKKFSYNCSYNFSKTIIECKIREKIITGNFFQINILLLISENKNISLESFKEMLNNNKEVVTILDKMIENNYISNDETGLSFSHLHSETVINDQPYVKGEMTNSERSSIAKFVYSFLHKKKENKKYIYTDLSQIHDHVLTKYDITMSDLEYILTYLISKKFAVKHEQNNVYRCLKQKK